jgi:hypothetical protein
MHKAEIFFCLIFLQGYEEEESVSETKKAPQRPGSTTSQHSQGDGAGNGGGEGKTEVEGGATSQAGGEEAESTTTTQQQPAEGTEGEG